MATALPTKMSLFENVTSLSTSSYMIGLDIYSGQLANVKISSSAAGYELSRKRWILNPPVTSSSDPRGDDGAESYDSGKYWIKSGSAWVPMIVTGSVSGNGTISSSFQLSDGGGEAFSAGNNVTFGRANIGAITGSKINITKEAKIGSDISDVHFVSGSILSSGSLSVSDRISIGKQTALNGVLDIVGDASITGSLTIGKYATSVYGYFINAFGVGRIGMSSSSMHLGGQSGMGTVIQSNGYDVIGINSIGNVGIGKEEGNAKLDVSGSATVSGSLTITNGDARIIGTSSIYVGTNTSSGYLNYSNNALVVNTNPNINLALGAGGSTYLTITSGSGAIISGSLSGTASYALYAKSNGVYNVRDYGAIGDGSTDNTTAFNNAIADIPSFGGTLYVPSGSYSLTNVNSIVGKKITIQGENRFSTRLKCASASGPMFTFTSTDGAIKDLTFVSSVTRNELTPLISASNCTTFQMQNISSLASGDLIRIVGGNWFFASDVFVRNDSSIGGVAIHARGPSLIFTNVILSNNNTVNTVKYPPLWVEGTDSTGMKISNSSFSGGGPLYRYTGATISSTADKFTITFPSTHDFGINEYVIISGSGASQYHNYWRVAGKTSNTVIVSSSLNLGSFSPDLVYSIPCSAVITNKYGAINESEMVGVMFEAVGYPTDALSCGLFVDGTKSNSNISGWKFNSCYFDYGKIGALVMGGGTTGTNTTTARLMFSNAQCETPFRGMSIEQAHGITVNNLQGPMYLINSDVGNCGMYLYSNKYGTGLKGINISNSSLGGDQSWQERAVYTRAHGLIIDGNIEGLNLNNNLIWGISGSVIVENNTNLSGSNIRTSNNLYYSGSADLSLVNTLPTISSATTITIPWNDQINITGSNSITTISGGWKSREVSFILTDGLTFNTGGNIATSKVAAAGEVAKLMFDGNNWRHYN